MDFTLSSWIEYNRRRVTALVAQAIPSVAANRANRDADDRIAASQPEALCAHVRLVDGGDDVRKTVLSRHLADDGRGLWRRSAELRVANVGQPA